MQVSHTIYHNGFGTNNKLLQYKCMTLKVRGEVFPSKSHFSVHVLHTFIIANLAKFRLLAEHCYLTACFHFVFWYGFFMCVCLSLRSFMYDGTVFSLNISGFILCVIHKHFVH